MSRKHRIVVGVDEAGYGPRLGPLVVALAAFRLPAGAGSLRELLPLTRDLHGPAPVDDSKRVYRGGKGLDRLERTVLAFRSLSRQAEVPDLPAGKEPWDLGEKVEGPVCGPAADLDLTRDELRGALEAAGVEPLELRTLTVGVREFNRGVDRWGSKARVLFEATAKLIRPWICEPGETAVFVDRHGGRAYYSSLLAEAFPDRHQWVLEEGRRVSKYRLPHDEGETVISFEVEGDGRHLSTALASMSAKYVRELSMRAFNRHFSSADPGLRPTAGYVQDARRWLEESRETRSRLGVSDADLVRLR